MRLVLLNMFKPSSLADRSRLCFFYGSILLVMSHVCLYHAVLSVPCSLVVTCWERADLLALFCFVLCHFPIYVSSSTSELRLRLVPLNMFKPSSIFFTHRSKTVLLLWILFVIYVPCLSLLCCLICSMKPYNHLLGRFSFVFLSLFHMVSRDRYIT